MVTIPKINSSSSVSPVVSHTDPVGRHVEQPLGPLQHVGQMTQHIFHPLLGLIGNVGEKAKCGNIDERYRR